jgi:hypothetical protein
VVKKAIGWGGGGGGNDAEVCFRPVADIQAACFIPNPSDGYM